MSVGIINASLTPSALNEEKGKRKLWKRK